MPSEKQTLKNLSAALAAGRVSSAELVQDSLNQIKNEEGEGARIFLNVDQDDVLAQAHMLDRLRREHLAPSPYTGIPIAVKDLFDVRGQITAAGSKVLRDAPVAEKDCTAIRRLRGAGLVILGRTNMTEFAYSGLGMNPHYGTPTNPYDRATGRIPGGSSSGTAVAIADDIVSTGLGTDTGGSCRIPAAFCGVVGFKSTAARIPRDGVYPLATSFDSIGPLANTVACCAAMDAIMAGEPELVPQPAAVETITLGVLTNYVLDSLDAAVANNYQRALARLRGRGVRLIDFELPELHEIPALYANGGLVGAEAYALHRELLTNRAGDYDPRVSTRIVRAETLSAADFIDLMAARRNMITKTGAVTAQFDAVIMPTVPIIPPTFSELEKDDEYLRLNALVLRNPSIGNYLDRCAVSIPIHEPQSAPVGVMLMGETGTDRQLFALAQTIESLMTDRD
ncbi:MAG: amidase [Acidobacteria bacterium]|nr:amidase [Acidobacteriota bacterium]